MLETTGKSQLRMHAAVCMPADMAASVACTTLLVRDSLAGWLPRLIRLSSRRGGLSMEWRVRAVGFAPNSSSEWSAPSNRVLMPQWDYGACVID